MPKYYGTVGFVTRQETVPGVWTDKIVELDCYGDMYDTSIRYERGIGANEDVSMFNTVSILGTTFFFENFHYIRYITYLGTRWKVTSIKPSYPRLILSLGGIYNGPTPGVSSCFN